MGRFGKNSTPLFVDPILTPHHSTVNSTERSTERILEATHENRHPENVKKVKKVEKNAKI
jgi:hypothetical protein